MTSESWEAAEGPEPVWLRSWLSGALPSRVVVPVSWGGSRARAPLCVSQGVPMQPGSRLPEFWALCPAARVWGGVS